MYEVDDLVRSYRMSLDSDPEYSGPAEDLFKSQKAKIEKQLKALEKFERMFEIMQKHFYVCRGFIEGRITTEKNFKECLKNSWTKYYNGMSVVDDDYEELFNLWNEVLGCQKD